MLDWRPDSAGHISILLINVTSWLGGGVLGSVIPHTGSLGPQANIIGLRLCGVSVLCSLLWSFDSIAQKVQRPY